MEDKSCPNCKLWNPPNAMRCDCGYDFNSSKIETSYSKNPPKKKLKGYEHIICGWPLILIFIGGAIGGVCGGLAYGINAKIISSNLSNGKKYTFTALVGLGAFALYSIAIIILAAIFPDLFKK